MRPHFEQRDRSGNSGLSGDDKPCGPETSSRRRLALAPEYTAADISPIFKPNGTDAPDSDEYQALADKNFADWRLDVRGLAGDSHATLFPQDELQGDARTHSDHAP